MEGSKYEATRASRALERTQRSRPAGAVVYGPLRSRRLGRSLGVNLSPPGCRVCSFSCIYCEIPRVGSGDPDQRAWPTPGAVAEALACALRRCGPLDSITISGNGEPTLHPDFGVAVSCVLAEARRLRPRVPVRILSNGSEAVRPEIRRALDLLDERIVTLDAAPAEIDRPDPGSPLGGLLHGLSLLRDVSVQSCFVDGAVSNTGDDVVDEWADLVAELAPRRVQVYTVNRKPATRDIWPVSEGRLRQIASILRERAGIRAQVVA